MADQATFVEDTEPFLTGAVREIVVPEPAPEHDHAGLMAKAIDAYSDLAAADDRFRVESVEVLRATRSSSPSRSTSTRWNSQTASS